MNRLLCALALALAFALPAAAKDHTDTAKKHYTCDYCNTLADPVSCCWKVDGCETAESAGGKYCKKKASASGSQQFQAQTPPKTVKKPVKKMEPYKPMGLAKKTPKREPTFTCDYCNSVTGTASCCQKVAGCGMVDRAGGRVCKKAE